MGGLIFRRESILLVERGREPLKGYWSLPGGLVETGEKLEDALKREILEETGLRIQPVKLFEIFQRIMHDPAGRVEYHYVLADYVCKVVGGELRAGDDVSSVQWVKRGEVPDFRLTEGTLVVIQRAFHARRRRS